MFNELATMKNGKPNGQSLKSTETILDKANIINVFGQSWHNYTLYKLS